MGKLSQFPNGRNTIKKIACKRPLPLWPLSMFTIFSLLCVNQVRSETITQPSFTYQAEEVSGSPAAATEHLSRREQALQGRLLFLQAAETELQSKKAQHYALQDLVFRPEQLPVSSDSRFIFDADHFSNHPFIKHEKWVLDTLHKVEDFPPNDNPTFALKRSQIIGIFTAEYWRLDDIKRDAAKYHQNQVIIREAEILVRASARQAPQYAGAVIDTGTY